MTKPLKIIREAIPILIMIGLIPLIGNDYTLTLCYIVLIVISLSIKKEKGDMVFLVAGFIIMLISESIFISTSVETFTRNSLFGLMPLWLPFLWAYAFVAIRRSLHIIER